jgi:hypothetical protein
MAVPRGTAMALLTRCKKAFALYVPAAEILVSNVPISNRALSRIDFLTLSGLR